jgi:hypothetical protein
VWKLEDGASKGMAAADAPTDAEIEAGDIEGPTSTGIGA